MSSIEYQPPTGLSGAYDPIAANTTLEWTASVDGIPELFTSSGTYTVDPTSDHVQVTGLGAGGGATSATCQANSANGGSFGGYGGAGGAYAQATFPITTFGSTVAVTIGAPGAGGALQVADINGTTFFYGNPGSAGGNTVFGSVLTAGGGAGGVIGSSTLSQAAGGTATVTGGSSITTESGGAGSFLQNNGSSNISVAAGNSTLAGAGGGSGGLPLAGSTAPLAGGTAGSTAGGVAGTDVVYPTGTTGGAGGAGAAQSGILGGSGGGGGGSATPPGGGTGSGIDVPFTGGAGGVGGGYGGGGGGSGMAVAFVAGLGPSHHQYAYGTAGGDGGPGVLETITYWLHTHDPQYIVYRNGVPIGVTGQGVTGFVDNSPLAGANTYTVYASYDGVSLNSAASDPFTVTVSLGNVFVSGKFSPANAFAPIMLINLKGVKPKFYAPVINPNMRSRR